MFVVVAPLEKAERDRSSCLVPVLRAQQGVARRAAIVAACLLLVASTAGAWPELRVVSAPDPAPPEPSAATCRPCGRSDLRLTFTNAWQIEPGALNGPWSCRVYAFDVIAGGTYELSTCGTGGGSANFDSLIQVVDPQAGCIVLGSNDDCDISLRSFVSFTSPFTGTAHARVSGSMGGWGSYELAYRSVGTACASCVGRPMFRMQGCGCARGELTPSCDTQWLSGWLTAGRTFTATTCGLSWCGTPGGMPGSDFDVRLRLLDRDCSTILAVGAPDCGGTGTTLTYVPPANVSVLLEVSSATGVLGQYTTCQSQLDCEPWPQALTPLQGRAGATRCESTRTETFAVAVQPGATVPVSYDWVIHAPPGAAAIPSAGNLMGAGPGGAASFQSALSGLGIYLVEITASNACGSGTWLHRYEYADRTAPLILPPASQLLECPSAPVAQSPRVRDNCDQAPALALQETIVPGACPQAYTLRRTWTATDASFNSSTATQIVRVRDTAAPAVTPDGSVRHCVFPPDHGRACFTFTDFTPIAADACPGPIAWHFARVIHDEAALGACDPPDAEPDIEVAVDGSSFCVRAERCIDDDAVSPGRRYLVEAIAVDACGNASPLTVIGAVLVPQDSADTTSCRVPVPWD